MALEMRVYDELRAIDPKVMAGLTMRQLATVTVLVVVDAALIGWLWLAGHHDAIQWVAVVSAAPAAVIGWIKPLGLKPEVWLAHVWRWVSRPRRLVYINEPIWGADRDRDNNNSRSRRRGRVQRDQVVEAGH